MLQMLRRDLKSSLSMGHPDDTEYSSSLEHSPSWRLDSTAASWKDWAFKFENMAAAVVPSSRDTLDWAAQQDTPILNVDDVEACPDSVEINPQVYVALAELLEGEALDIVQNMTRGAGLEAWRKLVRRFVPQTVGRKRTLLSRLSILDE